MSAQTKAQLAAAYDALRVQYVAVCEENAALTLRVNNAVTYFKAQPSTVKPRSFVRSAACEAARTLAMTTGVSTVVGA